MELITDKKRKENIRKHLIARYGNKCHYCNMPEKEFMNIWGKFYKTRGKRLEVDRKDNNKGYTLENCCLACAICNNAKSNKFTEAEFMKVGRVIKKIWQKRAKNMTMNCVLFNQHQKKGSLARKHI